MSDSQYIPLVSYTKAPSKDKWSVNEERKCEYRQRHWGLAFWTDTRGRHAVEYGVITESMPDFCGGLLVYSPFVNVCDESCSWTSHFCASGAIPDEETVATEWKNFEEDMAVNLNPILNIKEEDEYRPTRTTVENYCWEALGAQIAGEMLYHGKMGWCGADHGAGRMHRLMDGMLRAGKHLATPASHYRRPGIHDEIRVVRPSGTQWTQVVEWDVDRGRDWRNANSGNIVSWVSGNIIENGDGFRESSGEVRCDSCDWGYNVHDYSECPECGCTEYYNDDYYEEGPMLDEGTYKHGEAGKLVSTTKYAERARRFFWRNG